MQNLTMGYNSNQSDFVRFKRVQTMKCFNFIGLFWVEFCFSELFSVQLQRALSSLNFAVALHSYNLFRGKRIEKHFIRDILITTHLVNVKCTYSKV